MVNPIRGFPQAFRRGKIKRIFGKKKWAREPMEIG
jgi:hypothetical protein